ncbi:MAG TPA: tetratricopeptide repeat protein [Polyangia bacterium]|nr:tetratricopeptide repeat protein [Polyangia bacterium]
MDVRCDRCQTEYELDDASVTADGATVQCTTCGHTFVVMPPAPPTTFPVARMGGTPAPVAGTSSNPTPSWMLTTEEGKTHRFRDSTTLQKWIVERRVTRDDRVCAPGGAWRRLGDVEELRPFFDVVDQADRAAAAARIRPTRPETPRASRPGPAYVSPDPEDGEVLTSESGRRPAMVTDDDLAAAGVGSRRTRILLIVGGFVLAAGVGYVAFRRAQASAPAAPPVAAAPAAPPVAAPQAAPAPPPPAPAPAAAPPPVAPAPPVTAAPPVAPAVPAPAPAPAAAPAAAAPGAHPPALPAAEASRPRSYERLIADGDHALENGQTGKAQKLYDEALRMQPNGVAAMTGSAYVLLDRQKPLAAIDLFKRALGTSPGFSQALFGLGEAYRLEGQPVQAVAAYKRYLEAAPGGADAPAARRQIRELESQTAASGRPPASPTEPPPAP